MKRTSALLLAAAGLFAAPVLGHAQTWSSTQPSITANATIPAIRQFNTTNMVNLDFGSVTPGVTVTVAPTDATSAKANIRFNTGTQVTVDVPAALTLTGGTATIATSSPICNVADSSTGTGAIAFACATGHEWLNASVTGMTEKWVLIGATLDGTATANAPAGTYTGNIVITLGASSS